MDELTPANGAEYHLQEAHLESEIDLQTEDTDCFGGARRTTHLPGVSRVGKHTSKQPHLHLERITSTPAGGRLLAENGRFRVTRGSQVLAKKQVLGNGRLGSTPGVGKSSSKLRKRFSWRCTTHLQVEFPGLAGASIGAYWGRALNTQSNPGVFLASLITMILEPADRRISAESCLQKAHLESDVELQTEERIFLEVHNSPPSRVSRRNPGVFLASLITMILEDGIASPGIPLESETEHQTQEMILLEGQNPPPSRVSRVADTMILEPADGRISTESHLQKAFLESKIELQTEETILLEARNSPPSRVSMVAVILEPADGRISMESHLQKAFLESKIELQTEEMILLEGHNSPPSRVSRPYVSPPYGPLCTRENTVMRMSPNPNMLGSYYQRAWVVNPSMTLAGCPGEVNSHQFLASLSARLMKTAWRAQCESEPHGAQYSTRRFDRQSEEALLLANAVKSCGSVLSLPGPIRFIAEAALPTEA
ncbi:hypothetical protein DFP72DRAFT_852167 [Ephemerocybe angulata]|uniref:Uncharacterized protein n=1 Tax=Ephemerocybe angulata TaxID=980116 RepID=A0A8H6HMS5_9AGAR|nr:hypothetical protein DFP72DRAFT_852167 [Tulosesus angulatus]